MCGIVGYIGKNSCARILLDGLSKLEYRGYDSAGIAVLHEGEIRVEKKKGRLSLLSDMLNGGDDVTGNLGIGHTRWATHGKPSDVNSHPHRSADGKIAVVHNGIIENYRKLRAYLEEKGYVFVSDTDTEVLAHLLDHYYNGDIVDATFRMMQKVEGSYALGILCADNADSFIAVRKDSPLVIGVGEDENFVASDVPAILRYTDRVIYPENGEVTIIRRNNITILNSDREEVKKEISHITWDVEAAEKGGFRHFMMKEISEQPRAIRDTVMERLAGAFGEEITLQESFVRNLDKICITACGSAYHVGVAAKYILEKLTRIPVEVDLASEFRYRSPIISTRTLVVIISQSGETADSIAALREAKRLGAQVLSIVNVIGSTIAKESDNVIYTHAGPEIAVATTKAFSTQLSVIYLLAIYLAKRLGAADEDTLLRLSAELRKLPDHAEKLIEEKEQVQRLASRLYGSRNIFFIGRGEDYATALEGSLKLKEISYIFSEAYAAGELKHGTISLIEEGTPVVALMTDNRLADKMMSNIREVKARGAFVTALITEGMQIGEEADAVITIPKTDPILTPSLAVIPLQLLAYYVASLKGCDIDKPRNLAKSVTVE